MSSDCNKCKIIPLTVKKPQSGRFSDQLKRNTMKTIYQGQPSNIIITRVLSDSAVIEFTQTGNPVSTRFELSTGGTVSNTYSVEGGQSRFQATGLLPGTLYEVNVILTYRSGDQFPVNHTKRFLTLAKWKVPSVSYIYPRNKTIEVSQNFNYSAIDLSFDLSPGSPTQYIVRVDDADIHTINSYYLKPLLYPIYIRNDRTTSVQVITEYKDDEGYNDVSFTHVRNIQPFLEGTSSTAVVKEGAEFIHIAFSKAPGNPIYLFLLQSDDDVKIYQKYEYSNGIMDIALSEFKRDTQYNVYLETYYVQSGNTYRNVNAISFTTLNHSPIQHVQCFATNRSLTFRFESPTGEFLNTEQYSQHSYFSMILRDEFGNDVSSNAYVSNNTTEITYTDLDIHAEYIFLATAYYSDEFYYSYERTEKTLYEEVVQHVIISNIQGTTVDISYTPFTLPNVVPSIPDYYVIHCIDPFGISNTIQTYNTHETLTNVLTPDTTYHFKVTSIYSSGNSYEVTTNTPIHTRNEGPVESIILDRVKGDRIDFSWKKYDRLQTPSVFKIDIYQNVSPNEFVDISYVRTDLIDISTYHSCQTDIFSLTYDTEYKFVFISEFPFHIYSRSVFAKTPNEYYVKLFRVIADSTSVEFYKNNITNNQDKYIFVRTPNVTDIDLNTWAEQDVSSSTVLVNPTYFAGENTTFSQIEMSKNGLFVLFCPNHTEIQIFKQFEKNTIIESSITGESLVNTEYYHSLLHTVYPGKTIMSMSANYAGNMFIVGFNDNTVYLYDISYTSQTNDTISFFSCTKRPTIDVSGTTSRSVVISPSGNIFAVSNGELRDSIFIMDVIHNTSYNYAVRILANDNWFKTILNKYVQFDEDGSIMTVGLESFFFPIDGTASSVTTHVKVLDRTVFPDETFYYTDRNIDISGSRVSLNISGTKLAVVDNYDVSSNSMMYGSVSIYNISASNVQRSHTFWGSENMGYRNCSINDNGNVVAIGEYTFSYKPAANSLDGQVSVYELSGNSWSLKGFPIRQTDDVDPIIASDTILTGEWFGYKLIVDGTGDNLLTSTRPKLNLDLSVDQGKGFFYRWKTNDDIYKFNIVSWPVVVKNLIPLRAYTFKIYSTYDVDPGYSYVVDVSLSTLSGHKPDVSFSIYDKRILLSWKSVLWDRTIYDTLKYTVRVTQGNTRIVDISMLAVPGFYDISYDIAKPTYDLTSNTAYHVVVSSDFTRKIYDALNVESIVQFIYKNEETVSTLNERASDIRNIVALNSPELVVFDVENAGVMTDISQNKITLMIERNGMSYSYVIVPPSMLDIRQHLQLNDKIKYIVETTYKKQSDSGVFIYNNSTYSISGDFDVSNGYVPNTLIQNGRFYPEISYANMLEFEIIKRYPVEVVKGIFRIIPPNWSEESQYIVAIENRPPAIPTISAQLPLNVVDISYHVVLYRSEDLAPGTQITPARLTQTLQGSVFATPYTISFYIRNQDVSSVIYDNKTKLYFSEDIKYQIEFADVLNNDYIFYKTSPIRNTNKQWMKFQCQLNFPISRKNVKFAIRRLDKELNNLYISDISMIFTNKPNEPYAFLDGSWNCLSVSPTPWKDIWTYDGSFQVIQLSCNMSISCWFYLHNTDISQCIFLLGTDVSNGTPGIYIDNSNITVKNAYDDSSYNHILTTPSVLGVATHFVLTYFNNTISTYMNGIPCQVVDVSKNMIREAHNTHDNIYLGNPKEKTLGVVLKSVKLYDYQLDLSFIANSLYKADKELYQIGNPYDISANQIRSYFTTSTPNERQVKLPVLDRPTLTKKVFLNASLPHSSDVSSVSMWIDASSSLYIDHSLCVCTTDTFTFRGHPVKLKNAVNHFAITNEARSLKLYMNGYLYLTDPSPMTSISGSNLGEVVLWNKVLSESNILTSYYNYYHLYSSYDISGHYKLYVKYPKGIDISARTVDYRVVSNPYTDVSGVIQLYDGGSDISYVIIRMAPLTLNTFHKKQDTIRVRLSDYQVVHDIFAEKKPYIQYSLSNNIQYVTEATTVDFWIENPPLTSTTFPYTINGGITGTDLSSSFDISGMIGNQKVSIVLREDYTIEDMEALLFNVPSLNLSTLLYVYDRLYLTSNKSYANNGDVFTITLRTKITSPNTGYNNNTGYRYRILGVSGEDISGADLSGTITFNNPVDEDVSLSFVDISFVVTANETTRVNLPFKLILADDFSYVSISLWLNDFYNLTTNNTTIYEGDEFSFTFKTPNTVRDNTLFAYTITGISSEDLDISSEYGGLSGNFVSKNATAAKKFKYKYNALPDQNKTMNIFVAKNGLLETDLSFSSRILNVEPVFALRGPVEVNEGESFTITLEDLSRNLPNGTEVVYKLVYVDSATNEPLLDSVVESEDVSGSISSSSFTLHDCSGTANFTAIADRITDQDKTIQIMLADFPNVFWRVDIYDTSKYPIYDLSCDKVGSVNEGDTFKITLEFENIPDGTKVPFDISGTIRLLDILGLSSMHDVFTIPYDISRSYTVKADKLTEGKEKAEFRLTSETNSDIMVAIDINDSSQAPVYKVNIVNGAGATLDTITKDNTFYIDLSTNNVNKGVPVGFSLSGLSSGDLTSSSLTYSNSKYTGTFTVGANERISVTSNINTTKTGILKINNGLYFVYNKPIDNIAVKSQGVRFT